MEHYYYYLKNVFVCSTCSSFITFIKEQKGKEGGQRGDFTPSVSFKKHHHCSIPHVRMYKFFIFHKKEKNRHTGPPRPFHSSGTKPVSFS